MTQDQRDDTTQPEAETSAGADSPDTDLTTTEPEPDLEHHDDHEDHRGSSFARTALMLLIGVLVIFGLALWLTPKFAPYLPAEMAKLVMPGQQRIDEQFEELRAAAAAERRASADRIAALESQLAEQQSRLAQAEEAAAAARSAAETAQASAEAAAAQRSSGAASSDALANAAASASEAAATADIAAKAATEAGKVAASATRDAAALSRRMISLEARLTSLRDELTAVNQALASGGSAEGGVAASPELAAAVAQLNARVDALSADAGKTYLTAEEALGFATQDDLRSARTALETQIRAAEAKIPGADVIATQDDLASLSKATDTRIGDLDQRVGQAEETVKAAVESATAAQEAGAEALGKVEGAIRDASMRSAVAAVTSRIENGVSYGAALAEIADLSGKAPPEALSAHAETGLPTKSALLKSFGRPAQAAIGADLEAEAGDGLLSWADAKLRSKVGGRPKSEQPGDTTGAIISRVEARLREGDLAAALAEAETLSEPAKAALGPWLDDLRARVAADAALDSYLAGSAGQQG